MHLQPSSLQMLHLLPSSALEQLSLQHPSRLSPRDLARHARVGSRAEESCRVAVFVRLLERARCSAAAHASKSACSTLRASVSDPTLLKASTAVPQIACRCSISVRSSSSSFFDPAHCLPIPFNVARDRKGHAPEE